VKETSRVGCLVGVALSTNTDALAPLRTSVPALMFRVGPTLDLIPPKKSQRDRKNSDTGR
jgi:hypothetical protein